MDKAKEKTMKKRIAMVMVVCGLACTPQQAKTVENVVVKVTTELCAEEASDPNEPELVKLACQVEGGLVHLPWPRTAWLGMKAAAKAK